MNIWNPGIEKTQNTSTSEHGGLVEEKNRNKNHSWKIQNSEEDRQGKFLCFCDKK